MRGFVVVAPEHRVSFILKNRVNEEALCRSLHEDVINVMNERCIDIYDEVDAMVHPKWELVYALGEQQALKSAESRWSAIQANLRIVCRSPGHAVMKLLKNDRIAIIHDETFNKLRLLRGSHLDQNLPLLLRPIAQQLFEDPPYEIRWLKPLSDAKKQELIPICIDSTIPVPDVYQTIELDSTQADQILTIRACLAHRVVISALTKRPRVDYGVPTGRRLLLAVPFRASDVPAERAESSHQDSVITLTYLSFYHSGVTAMQLRECLR